MSELENLPLKEDKIKLGFETETVTLRLPEKSQNDIMNKNVMIGHDPNKNVMYRLYGTQKIPETYHSIPKKQLKTILSHGLI